MGVSSNKSEHLGADADSGRVSELSVEVFTYVVASSGYLVEQGVGKVLRLFLKTDNCCCVGNFLKGVFEFVPERHRRRRRRA